MKKQIEITTERNFPVSKNFERKVKKLMPDKVNQLHIIHLRMTRTGYGQYKYEAYITVNKHELKLTQKTTDAMAYDYYIDLEYNTKKYKDWCKNVTLNLLEYQNEIIVDLIDEI